MTLPDVSLYLPFLHSYLVFRRETQNVTYDPYFTIRWVFLYTLLPPPKTILCTTFDENRIQFIKLNLGTSIFLVLLYLLCFRISFNRQLPPYIKLYRTVSHTYYLTILFGIVEVVGDRRHVSEKKNIWQDTTMNGSGLYSIK